MEKQTPKEALQSLRREVEDEIIKSRSEEKKGTNSFTAVFMSEETYVTLKNGDIGGFVINGLGKGRCKDFGITVESALACYKYYGYVVMNNDLAYGKVVIRRCCKKVGGQWID